MRAPHPALAVAVPGLGTELSLPTAGSCAESQPPGIPAGTTAAAGHGVTVLPGREWGWGCAQALPSLLPCSPQPGPRPGPCWDTWWPSDVWSFVLIINLCWFLTAVSILVYISVRARVAPSHSVCPLPPCQPHSCIPRPSLCSEGAQHSHLYLACCSKQKYPVGWREAEPGQDLIYPTASATCRLLSTP